MAPKANSSRISASGGPGSATPAATAGCTTPAAAQQPQAPEAGSFAIVKLQRALAVPPNQRQPSMQGFIGSCECTTEATRLLAAAPLAQLGGPAQLRALLLLIKAYIGFDGRVPVVPGVCLQAHLTEGRVPEQARLNLLDLLHQDPDAHLELQPLFYVAARAAVLVMLYDLATRHSSAASIANSRTTAVAQSIAGRRSTDAEQKLPPLSLQQAAGRLDALVARIRQSRSMLQQQLAGVGGGLLTVHELELELLVKLGMVHTWAATPDGAYCGGRVDQRHVTAGRAAFSAALQLSDSSAWNSGLLVALSNLLRRTGAAAEAEGALCRAVAAARAAGDALLELNAAAALFSVMASRNGWRYAEGASLVESMQRCLRDCKPWLSNPVWSKFREQTRYSEGVLAAVRDAFPTSYARRLSLLRAPPPARLHPITC